MKILSNILNSLNKDITVYGSPGNRFGKTMVGGLDVQNINDMLARSFQSGQAGRDSGPVNKIGTYKGKDVFEQQAADQIRISIDDEGKAYLKLIARGDDPGLGLLALAGGFKDEGETDQMAADREETEEAKGATGDLIAKYEIARHPVPGDVRVWGGADRPDGVKKGDVIAMSTTAMIPVVKNANSIVEAGDDAKNAGWVALSDLEDANLFGIKGHANMVVKAAELAGLEDQLPASFKETLLKRSDNILVASEEQRNKAQAVLDKDKGESASSTLSAAAPKAGV